MASTLVSQSFAGHVYELRRRLFWSVLVLIGGSGLGFIYRRQVLDLLVKPLNLPLFYTAPSGSFEFIMRISLSLGTIVALPVLIYNLVRFAEPAFEKRRRPLSRKRTLIIVAASVTLALAGITFAYAFILPTSFHFFSEFNIGPIKPLISTSEYLGFVLGCLVTFAIVFQLPLVLLAFNSISRFPPKSLSKYRRHVIIGSLAIALILPFTYDPITQFIVAIPIIVLYETSLLLLWLNNNGHHKREAARRKLEKNPIAVRKSPITVPPVRKAQPSRGPNSADRRNLIHL